MDPNQRRQLLRLLRTRFSPARFRARLRSVLGSSTDVVDGLPPDTVSPTAFFDAALTLLESRGLMNDEFIRDLLDPDPYRLEDIDDPRSLSFGVEPPLSRSPKSSGLDGDLGDDADPPPSEHVVSTGFAAAAAPVRPLASDRPLRTGASYYFWLEVGAAVDASIELTPAELPVDLLPRDARLDVLLFTGEGGLVLADDEARGELLLSANGPVRVTRPASRPQGMRVRGELMRRRLFFAVRTPPRPGTYQLRCSIHCRRVLVQSRDIQVTVAESDLDVRPGMLTSRVDYTLTRKLSAATLAGLGEHRLSLLVNDSGPASHGFRFCAGDGGGELHGSATVDVAAVQNLVANARKAYREVSWGPGPFDPRNYRYQQPGTYETLRTDLVTLARRGYAMYAAIAGKLAGGAAARQRLRALMTSPGQIQLALKSSARLVLPLALFYDHDLDGQLPPDAYRLCDAYKLAHRDDRVADCDCLRGRCPNREQRDVVCPGGFWGFRHDIGMPVSLGDADAAPTETATAIVARGAPHVLLVRSHDPELQQADAHIRSLRELVGDDRCVVADTRAQALGELGAPGRHLVYFYCHGGLDDDGNPCLHVGPPGDPAIAADNLLAFHIRWDAPQPLVVINGCHTVDVEPERAIDLVGAFLDTAGAAGVVGTEITVFEPLATAFAQLVVPAFLQGVPLGAAIRRARVELLASQHNPLGLVYIPFALSSLALVQAGA